MDFFADPERLAKLDLTILDDWGGAARARRRRRGRRGRLAGLRGADGAPEHGRGEGV